MEKVYLLCGYCRAHKRVDNYIIIVRFFFVLGAKKLGKFFLKLVELYREALCLVVILGYISYPTDVPFEARGEASGYL